MRDNNKTSLDIPKWYITKSRQEPKVCVKYAGPMELWNDALVTPYEGQSRRRLSHLRLSANTAMLRTACFLCVIGHRELLHRYIRRAVLPPDWAGVVEEEAASCGE